MKNPKDPTDFIRPLTIDGMHGRVLTMPAQHGGDQQLLLVYGHHSSLERIFGIADDLSQYAAIAAPDLPGFGGMDTFYKIGKKPTLDNFADYLAAFIMSTYHAEQRVNIVGMSLGFAVVTRMLQRHPELRDRIGVVMSMVGLVHKDDFRFKPTTAAFWKTVGYVGSLRPVAWFIRHVLLTGPVIRATYALVADRHVKLRDASPEERERRVAFEVGLWQMNEVRTYLQTGLAMFRLNLLGTKLPFTVYHTAVPHDRYFDNAKVEQHLRSIYASTHIIYSEMQEGHAPTVVADAAAAAKLLPNELRKLLQSGMIL